MKLKNIGIAAILVATLGGCANHSEPNKEDFSEEKGANHCGDVYTFAASGGTRVFAEGTDLEGYSKPLRLSDRRKMVFMIDVSMNKRGYINFGNATLEAPETEEDIAQYEFMATRLADFRSEESVNSIANACLKKFLK